MTVSSSASDIVCSSCGSVNPAGTSSCRRCQRFLGAAVVTQKNKPKPATVVVPPPRVQPIVVTPTAVTGRSVPQTRSRGTRTGSVVTPPVATSLAPVGPASRPEDGTTRYLCAAAHRSQTFSDSVIAEFLLEEVRAVPPSPGLDSAAVLRDAVAARARRRVRDALVLGLFALLILLAPVGAAVWAVVSLVARRELPEGGRFRRHVGGAAVTALAAALAVVVPVASAATGFGLVPAAVAGASSAVLTLAILAVLAADQFVVHRLVHERFQAGQFVPDYRTAPVAWERKVRSLGHDRYETQLQRVADADEYGPLAATHADVIVHRGSSPFIGAGLPLATQTIALPLEPDPNHPGGPADISVVDLHTHVAAALVSLSSATSLVPGMRLEGILHREQVLIPVHGLMVNLRTALGSAALKGLDQPPARHVSLRAARSLADHPLEWARYYSCFRVESWNRDLATTCYLYAGTDQQMLYLELTHCILPPISPLLQGIDYVVEFGAGPVCGTARDFLRLPATAAVRLRSLTRRLAPRTRKTRGVIPERYGASLSLREHVAADSKPSSHFLKADATRYVKIVDTKLFSAVGDYLKKCGYDVAEFQRAVRTTINQNSINISGGNFAQNNFSAGNNNQNTTTNTSASGQQNP